MLGNREIKFRQYESMYGVMIQWEGDPDGTCEAHQQGLKEAISQYGWDALYNGSIFMQYTGLKDRNGKEIYEGDIVRHLPSAFAKLECEGEVFWFNGHARFALRGAQHYLDALNTYEVIGNIYEHPNLLKEANNNAQTK